MMADETRRALPRLLRSIRTATPGLRARIDDVEGDLVSVSATGALIRTARDFPVGTTCPIVLDLETARIPLIGQVVRREPLPIELPGGAVLHGRSYALGLLFMEASGSAMSALAELCGGRFAIEALPYRVLVLGDDSEMNDLVRNTLLNAGYPVHVVGDPRRIAAATREKVIDAVIANLRLDREPSLWWMLETMAAQPSLSTKALLVLAKRTALTADNRRYLTERRIRVLSVPFTPQELLTALERAIYDERLNRTRR